MAIWTEKLAISSRYSVPLGDILLCTTSAGATVRWRVYDTFNTKASFSGPDNVVSGGSTDALVWNAFTKSIWLTIGVDGGAASYKLLTEDDAWSYRKANGLPVGRGPGHGIFEG